MPEIDDGVIELEQWAYDALGDRSLLTCATDVAATAMKERDRLQQDHLRDVRVLRHAMRQWTPVKNKAYHGYDYAMRNLILEALALGLVDEAIANAGPPPEGCDELVESTRLSMLEFTRAYLQQDVSPKPTHTKPRD